MILALVFVKIDNIYSSINLLYDELPDEIFPLLEVLKKTIIWNVHDQVLRRRSNK